MLPVGATHHHHESIDTDRFKCLVGRRVGSQRSCRHDCATLPALCRTHRCFEKHGPLLCHDDRAQPVRRGLSHPSMGSYRRKRSKAGASFRAGGRGGQALPPAFAKETVTRIQAETAYPARCVGRSIGKGTVEADVILDGMGAKQELVYPTASALPARTSAGSDICRWRAKLA